MVARFLLSFLMMLFGLFAFSQGDSSSNGKVFCDFPEKYPEFIGGEKEMMKAIRKGLENSNCSEVESGKAIINFIVEPDGNVDSVVVKGAWCEDMRNNLKKTVQEFKFVPGTQQGKPVRIRYTLPISCIKPD